LTKAQPRERMQSFKKRLSAMVAFDPHGVRFHRILDVTTVTTRTQSVASERLRAMAA